ncbi:MAG: SDR family NAD(P)-dependent oxidoreductase [Myxococcales bacterium]|nr:SDR family NAD(P)-dependent oxidoreductase [Myxococcales bacterium]
MKRFEGKVAVVTGAASGIGRALAVALAERGARLALSDVDEAGLEKTTRLAAARGAEIDTHRVDVSSRAAVFDYAAHVVERFGVANLVINNAGVGLGATVREMSIEDLEWLMGINFWGVVYGTKAFLPHLERSGDGHIVNVSSVFGLIGVPTQSAYNAAKFAVRGFTEALREELDAEPCGVSCTCVHPGGIRTNIARNARVVANGAFGQTPEQVARGFDRLARTSSEAAAEAILRGVQANKRRVLIGADAYAIDAAQRLLPTSYQRVLVSVSRRIGRAR